MCGEEKDQVKYDGAFRSRPGAMTRCDEKGGSERGSQAVNSLATLLDVRCVVCLVGSPADAEAKRRTHQKTAACCLFTTSTQYIRQTRSTYMFVCVCIVATIMHPTTHRAIYILARGLMNAENPVGP